MGGYGVFVSGKEICLPLGYLSMPFAFRKEAQGVGDQSHKRKENGQESSPVQPP